ncbi:hypothetical protein ACHAXT_007685 [Thalassiosira profunda]
MPWLIKSTPEAPVPLAERLFFVHVPRCGGTSLMQHFSVPQKVVDARGPIKAAAMKYFFMRYKTLESANFPIKTRENGACAVLLVASAALYYMEVELPTLFGASLALWIGAIAIFVSLFTTIVCTAPVIGRITPVHRWYLWFVHYPLFRLCEAVDWCTGTNKTGYIMHLTAPKLLGYGYVKPEEMDGMCSLAIVRNPYSRMVSIYGYNRFGAGESFPAFLRRWRKLMTPYIERGEKEEWYTPCHLLPMFEYTHHDGKQLVQSVVKQEELKLLKTREGAKEAVKLDNTVSDLPDLVRDALLGMPHTNSRKTSAKWYDLYDQETMNLTYEMYARDFDVFGYSTAIEQRPDLVPPKKSRRSLLGDMKYDRFSRNSLAGPDGLRISQANLFGSVTNSVRTDMRRRCSATALKSSLIELDKDEILAKVAGVRHFSTVRETFHEDSMDVFDESNGAGVGSKKDD